MAASIDDACPMNASNSLVGGKRAAESATHRHQPLRLFARFCRQSIAQFALICALAAALARPISGSAQAGQTVELAGATVVTRGGQLPKAEQAATQVLVEELEKRIGKRLRVSTTWPKSGLVVAVTSGPADAAWGHPV